MRSIECPFWVVSCIASPARLVMSRLFTQMIGSVSEVMSIGAPVWGQKTCALAGAGAVNVTMRRVEASAVPSNRDSRSALTRRCDAVVRCDEAGRATLARRKVRADRLRPRSAHGGPLPRLNSASRFEIRRAAPILASAGGQQSAASVRLLTVDNSPAGAIISGISVH